MADFNGEIYRLELEKDVGFTFVKAQYLSGSCILTPLELVTADPKAVDLTMIEKTSPLCYDLLPSIPLPTRGKWKKVKDFNVADGQIIPDFKNDLSSQFWRQPDWNKIATWYLVRDLFPNGWTKVSYKQVSHLGVWQHSVPNGIRTKLTMFWLKKLGKNIKQIYKGEMDEDDHYWNLAAYYETQNLTFYSEVDPQLWNRMKE